MDNDVKEEGTNVPKETPTIDVEALAKKVEQLESSNSRLLDESKTWKEKYQGVKSEREKDTEAKLTENEQWKELLDLERNKVHELSAENKSLKTRGMQTDLRYKVASLAKDAHDVEDVVTAVAKSGMLSMDAENGSISGIEEAYNKIREEKPHFFNTAKKSGMSMGSPDNMIPKEKSAEEIIAEDPNAALAEALKGIV